MDEWEELDRAIKEYFGFDDVDLDEYFEHNERLRELERGQ